MNEIEALTKAREPRLRDAHGAAHDMNLPTGKTCGDCAHIERCAFLHGAEEADEKCDFSPNCFLPAGPSSRQL